MGHACGHNLIAICSLGAALATKAWLEEDSNHVGTVKLFGTPVPPPHFVTEFRVKKVVVVKLISSMPATIRTWTYRLCVTRVQSTGLLYLLLLFTCLK